MLRNMPASNEEFGIQTYKNMWVNSLSTSVAHHSKLDHLPQIYNNQLCIETPHTLLWNESPLHIVTWDAAAVCLCLHTVVLYNNISVLNIVPDTQEIKLISNCDFQYEF